MEKIKVIEVKENVLANNDRAAAALRAKLHDEGTMLINLMSSPADVDSDVDAYTVQSHGAKAIQLHTGGMCHLDAAMTEQGLRNLGTEGLDLVFLENVGNLICPAEFDTGAAKKVMILSAPEGHDKPLKYPLMFEVSDLVLVSKMDVAQYFDFSLEKLTENVRLRNPHAQILPLSAKTGEGMDAWIDWLRAEVAAWKA